MHKARKRFGQNFLHDPGIIRRIVASIAPRPGEHLVEIGPGLGALTREVLPLTGTLNVIELDRDLPVKLRAACAGRGELHIHEADALQFDLCALARTLTGTPAKTDPGSTPDIERPLRVFGNLPYNISTPLLFHLMDQRHCIADMHFMLQKEVVARMAAAPGSGEYGRLSVMLQYYCQVEQLFTVPPGAFTPAPRVDSAIVRLQPHTQAPVIVTNPDTLSRVVALAFSQRRKTLRNTLKPLFAVEAIVALDIDPGARAERLDLAAFARLANAVEARTPACRSDDLTPSSNRCQRPL